MLSVNLSWTEMDLVSVIVLFRLVGLGGGREAVVVFSASTVGVQLELSDVRPALATFEVSVGSARSDFWLLSFLQRWAGPGGACSSGLESSRLEMRGLNCLSNALSSEPRVGPVCPGGVEPS